MANTEYGKLYEQFVAATQHALSELRKYGMESREFAEADAKAGEIARQLKQLRR